MTGNQKPKSGTRVVRVDPEVMASLRQSRRPEDHNWSDVIRRRLRHRRYIAGGSDIDAADARRFFGAP